jgi:hypothetical protein
MTMFLGSNDLEWLEPVAKRLVAAGIPIAVCRPSHSSPCLEVWIQRDRDFAQACRVLAGGVVPPAATQAPANGVLTRGRQRSSASGRGVPKMLLASRDIVVLEPVAKELVASGIPIAVCKASDLSSYVEIWIQRDSERSAGPRLVVRGVVPGAATRAAVNRPCSGSAQRGSARRRGVSAVSSGIGRCVGWLLQLRQP